MVDPGHPQVIEGLTINPSNKHRTGFPGGSDSKESVCNAGDPSLIPGSGRSPGKLANEHPYSQSFGFSSSHIRCESWTIKKAEHKTIDAFEIQCWRRLLRAPWTTRRSNQSTLKKINPEYSLEGLMLKLKLQYFGHLIRRANSLEKTLMAQKDWGLEEKEDREDEMVGQHHQFNGDEFEQTPDDGWGSGHAAVHEAAKSWTQVRCDWVPEQQQSRKDAAAASYLLMSPAMFISPQHWVQWHYVSILKLAIVGTLIPWKLATPKLGLFKQIASC